MGAVAISIVVVASSAGGLNALMTMLGDLPEGFVAPVALVQHLDPKHRSLLPEILGRVTKLHVKAAEDGDLLAGGWVFVAPPDRHLVVGADGRLSLSRSEPVHFLRPSADVLFESAALAFGDRVVGVVLTGTGADASLGTQAIHERGGTVIAQDKESSEYFGMPGAAIGTGGVDHVLPLKSIATALVQLVASGPLR